MTHQFKPVDTKEDFPKMEREILQWWTQNDIEKKYISKNNKSSRRFRFIDGPITANNPMGIHTAEMRAFKDLWQRYKCMKGFKQRFQNGFDCQGLWVEVEEERELGFNSKKDILKFGIDNFTKSCLARVDRFSKMQTDQSKRLGMFMDWENSYYTSSNENNYTIWSFFKKCQEKDLLYQSQSLTTWCPRCETGLSQHEKLDGYRTIEDTSIYVKFKLKTKKQEYLLVWTTTPWTLSANVALAINTKFDYVKAKDGKDTLYLARESANRLGLEYEILDDAGVLLNLPYESLYDIPVQEGVEHKVVEWELVDPKEGTGIVHIAPGCGEEDFELGQKHGMAVLSPLNSDGTFGDGYGELTGKSALEVEELVLEYLRGRNVLYKTERVSHSYPHCWRCKTKCLFRLEDNWFINCTKLKPQLKQIVESTKWIPDFAGRRAMNWLDNMGDWMISRKRFYGLALPFYVCDKCNKITIAGSKEELKELAVEPSLVDKLPSPHRPWIDEIMIRCPGCNQEVGRIADVGDVWLDAGVVPFSTLKYKKDLKYWKKWYPAELVCEMIEQVRLWYYAMMVYSVVFEAGPPFETVFNGVEVRNENGERFSKSLHNAPEFNDAADRAGSDLIRWLYFSQSVAASSLRFGYSLTDDVKRRFYLMLWNSYAFFVTYANLHDWKPDDTDSSGLTNPLDRWVVSELNVLIGDVTKAMDSYDPLIATKLVEKFVSDLSTWYIRRSRDRFKEGDAEVLGTLQNVLLTLTRLLAPYVPFLAEKIYQNLRRDDDPQSVHLSDFPELDESLIDRSVVTQMNSVRTICSLGQTIRANTGLRVRQPLAQMSYEGDGLGKELQNIISDELNIRKIINVKSIKEFEVKGWVCVRDEGFAVAVDPVLSDELRSEGVFRDAVRKIQQARKAAGLKLGDKADIVIEATFDTAKLLEEQQNNLMEAVSAASISFDKKDKPNGALFVTIDT